jgi:hypothetical protein
MLTETEGEAFAQDLACRFIETSAKTAINVDKAFHDLGREITRCKRVYPTPFKPDGWTTIIAHRLQQKQDPRRGGCITT